MRKALMSLAVLAILVPNIAAAATPIFTNVGPQTVDSRAELAASRLYDVIAALPATDRKVVFHGLSSEMKAAVWREHLDKFAATHVLSAAQAQIVSAVRTFVSADVFAIGKSDPTWENQVHAPLKMLEDNARNSFSPDVLAAAFAQLGPEDISVSSISGSAATGLRRSGPIALQVSNCTCSVSSDLCWSSTCGGSICYRSDGDYGCGFMWNYQCDAKCERNQ
jgi:hypothetical protein